MSNLKKYLKVYKEDAQHKKAFEQYMTVISENQDFFTRHEVNEFFTDMIKDGTLVYDEGIIKDFFKKKGIPILVGAAMLANTAMTSLNAKTPLNGKLENSNKTEQVETLKIKDLQKIVDKANGDLEPFFQAQQEIQFLTKDKEFNYKAEKAQKFIKDNMQEFKQIQNTIEGIVDSQKTDKILNSSNDNAKNDFLEKLGDVQLKIWKIDSSIERN